MARENYDEALQRLLAHEGGYTNHPDDPGGPTNWGITIIDARKYWKRDATAADVKAMPQSAAMKIYRAKYWDAMRCDELPSGVDYAVFDYGVNSGVSRSIKVLERILQLPADGRPDDTLIARAKTVDAARLVASICDERLAFLKGLKTWPTFGKGWGIRVAEVRKRAGQMAKSAAMEMPPEPTEAVSVGAALEPPPSTTVTTALRTGGLVTTGLAAASQAVSIATGPVATTVSQVKEVIDTGGQVVDVTKQVFSVAPTGFWEHTLAFVQSPKFLLLVILAIGGAWAATWALRVWKERHP